MAAYGMAEATVAVSFSECGGGLAVEEVDADMLAVLQRAVPAQGSSKVSRLASLGPPLAGLQARVVDEDGVRGGAACRGGDRAAGRTGCAGRDTSPMGGFVPDPGRPGLA